ncbi:MAG: substrate-binding domain-containing protein [Christensenellales bacterium]|jgi:rhamnose transport system substrate-binding protein
MKKLFALLLAAMLVLSMGVAVSAETLPGDGITIGIVYKQSGNAYFQAGVEGFQKAADELGCSILHDGPEDSSNDGQERIIRNYIDQGVDVLAISANDAAGLVDVCKEAKEKGIVVLSWDAKVDAEGRDLDIQPASAKKIGLQQLESIAESIGYEGQLGIVSAGATAPNQNLWISYIEEALANDEAYANIEYVGVVYGDDDYTKSYDVTKALIDKYPEIKGLIVPTTNGGPAVAKCIMDEGKVGQIKMTGLTLATDMAEYIKAGIADATFLWNPIELGYVSAYVAVAMVNGEFDASVGATIEVPGFEGLEVIASDDGGNILYLNKLNAFTAETVDAWIGIL